MTSASFEWKITENRVTPPSTIISNTMSALLRPYCGRAFGSFGIRTLSGRRPICASAAAGRPVSGQTFGFGVGVGVGGAVGLGGWVGAAAAVGEPTATGVAPPLPQAPATTAQVKRTTVARRTTIPVDKRIGKRRGRTGRAG